MLDVFFRSDEDLSARLGRQVRERNPTPLEQHFRHLLETDPATSLVADDRGRLVAFGMSAVRGVDGFLSFLFVVPEWQGRGIGRIVVEESLRLSPIDRMATCADAVQPVSTGLYASMGLAPRLPVYILRGDIDVGVLPQLPSDIGVRPLLPEQLARFDESLLGYRRPQDHDFWSRHDRRGWVFESASGEMLGYSYAHPSGRIGPVAALESGHLPLFIGHAVRSTQVLEGWQCQVPGPAVTAMQSLLAAGLRIDGSPAIYCADHAGPPFDRYVPMSTALL